MFEKFWQKYVDKLWSLKTGFILTLVFVSFFHFIIPYIYFLNVGFSSNYQLPDSFLFDSYAYHLGMGMNVIGLLGAALIIFFLPLKIERIKPRVLKFPHFFFILSVGWGIYYLMMAGGFNGVLSGTMHGTLISYIGLFLSVGVVFILTLTQFKNISFPLICGLLVLHSILNASRATAVVLLVNLFVLMTAEVPFKKVAQYLIALVVVVLFSPYFFKFTSVLREVDLFSNSAARGLFLGDNSLDELTNAKDRSVVDRILGRASMLETSMLPIIYKENEKLRQEHLPLFYEKYDFSRQVKLAERYFFPRFLKKFIEEHFSRNFFDYGALPNQYYRVIFLKEPIENVIKRYVSINITFPVYAYMYSNAFVATVLYTTILVCLYLITIFIFRFSTVLSVVFFQCVYTFIYFFDWTDWIVTLLRSVLTAVAFMFTYWILSALSQKNILEIRGWISKRKIFRASSTPASK